MFNLDKLYQGHKPHGDNPLCEGCTILDKNKSCHSVMDYEEVSTADTLILSDSIKYKMGSTQSFGPEEMRLLKEFYPANFVTAAAVKCPSVKEADMTANDLKICRVHLEATIDKIKPKLVIPCGNLAMKMLLKKSGITNKRGKSFDYETEAGHTCKVVPVYHPYACIKEPRHKVLLEADLKNAYEKYVLHKETKGDFKYTVVMNIEDLRALADRFKESDETLAMDIETTGLNFLKDDIMTLSITSHENTWVIPLDHKDSPFKKGEPDYAAAWGCVRRILENPRNRKVFHNAKFDLKFLINYGVTTKNVWDTKILHHILDENLPKSLMDLTKLYFASELENL